MGKQFHYFLLISQSRAKTPSGTLYWIVGVSLLHAFKQACYIAAGTVLTGLTNQDLFNTDRLSNCHGQLDPIPASLRPITERRHLQTFARFSSRRFPEALQYQVARRKFRRIETA